VRPRRGARAAWLLAIGLALLVGILPQFAIGALGPQLRAELDLGPADLGWVFAGLYAFGVLGSPIAGALVDRIGGRRSCLGLLVVSGTSLLLASVATSRSGLILAMLPAGAAMAFANPGTNRWASAASTARGQAALVGVAQAGVQAGALVAGALAAASAVGLDWRGALRIGAGLALVGAVAAWRAHDDRSAGRSAGPVPDTSAPRGVAAPRTDPRRQLRILAGYALCMGAGTAIVFAYLPSFAVDTAGLSIAAAGATTLVFGSTALFCRLGLGLFLRVTTQTDSRLLLMMALGSVAAIAIIAAGAIDATWIWIGAVVFGATGTTWPALAFLAVVRAGPPGGAGRATGWVTAAFYLGLWVTPPIAGRLIVTAGYAWMWVAAAACYLLAVVPLWSARVASRPPVAGPVR